MNELIRQRYENFMNNVEELEEFNRKQESTARFLIDKITELTKQKNLTKEQMDIASGGIRILQAISEKEIQKAYDFLETSINQTLEQMFEKSTRKIKLKKSLLRGQYPQLDVELIVENGKKRSLKRASGRGLGQITSFITLLSLIVLTGGRRILIMDEVLSGVSAKNKMVIEDVMWAFTDIGFQFLCVEHGFIPKGANVYELTLGGETSYVAENHIEEEGFYAEVEGTELEKDLNKVRDYREAKGTSFKFGGKKESTQVVEIM